MLIEFEETLTWIQKGNQYTAYAGKRLVTRIQSHYLTGEPAMLWFENVSSEYDTSIIGDVPYLKERAQAAWLVYLNKLAKGETV